MVRCWDYNAWSLNWNVSGVLNMRYYFQSLFNDNLTFILGWEAFVLMMLLMFISIIIRLHRIERSQDEFQTDLLNELDQRL